MIPSLLACVFLSAPPQRAVQQSPGAKAAGIEQRAIPSGGRERTYALVVPKNAKGPMPLVVALHGRGGVGAHMIYAFGWVTHARSKGFIIAGPDALPAPLDGSGPPTWRVGGRSERINDLAFVRDVIADIAKRHKVDRKRVYVVGHSNGGAMALRLGNEASTQIAAIGAVAFQQIAGVQRQARPMPTIAMVGEQDPIIPPQGGPMPTPNGGTFNVPSASSFMARWAKLNGEAFPPTTVRSDNDMTLRRYGKNIEFWSLKGQGHGWPGADLRGSMMGPQLSNVNATVEIWKFFSKHKLP